MTEHLTVSEDIIMIRKELEATAENLNVINAMIDEQLEAADCPMKTQMQIDLAVEEIFVNIVLYAYAPDTGTAAVSFDITEDRVARIIFEDSGVPYDPLAKEDPDVTLSANERQIGGLGIFMVKKTMDSVSYEYSEGKNILTLEKRL